MMKTTTIGVALLLVTLTERVLASDQWVSKYEGKSIILTNALPGKRWNGGDNPATQWVDITMPANSMGEVVKVYLKENNNKHSKSYFQVKYKGMEARVRHFEDGASQQRKRGPTVLIMGKTNLGVKAQGEALHVQPKKKKWYDDFNAWDYEIGRSKSVYVKATSDIIGKYIPYEIQRNMQILETKDQFKLGEELRNKYDIRGKDAWDSFEKAGTDFAEPTTVPNGSVGRVKAVMVYNPHTKKQFEKPVVLISWNGLKVGTVRHESGTGIEIIDYAEYAKIRATNFQKKVQEKQKFINLKKKGRLFEGCIAMVVNTTGNIKYPDVPEGTTGKLSLYDMVTVIEEPVAGQKKVRVVKTIRHKDGKLDYIYAVIRSQHLKVEHGFAVGWKAMITDTQSLKKKNGQEKFIPQDPVIVTQVAQKKWKIAKKLTTGGTIETWINRFHLKSLERAILGRRRCLTTMERLVANFQRAHQH